MYWLASAPYRTSLYFANPRSGVSPLWGQLTSGYNLDPSNFTG